MNSPRCHEHRDRAELPLLCQTCRRIAVEQDIVRRAVDALLIDGYLLQTDIQDGPRPAEPTADRAAILAELAQVDDEFLGVFQWTVDEHGDCHCDQAGWIRFVYGNDGWDVISDYTTNLEICLAAVNAYADSLA